MLSTKTIIGDDEVAKLLHFDTMAIDLLDPSLL